MYHNKDSRGAKMTGLLRKAVDAYYDSVNNRILDVPAGNTMNLKYGDKRSELVRRIVKVLMMTDFINDITKRYLRDGRETYKSIAYDLGMNVNTVKSSVWYYMRKFCSQINPSDFYEIMYNTNFDLANIERKVIQMELLVYSKEDITEQLIVEVEKEEINAVLSDSEFEVLLDTLRPYAKKVAQESISRLTADMKGYFWYLVEYEAMLDGKDRENMNKLRDVLGLV